MSTLVDIDEVSVLGNPLVVELVFIAVFDVVDILATLDLEVVFADYSDVIILNVERMSDDSLI